MAATNEQIARLRRMTAEITDTLYDDESLKEVIERYPAMDRYKYDPYLEDGSDNSAWTPTYDLAMAASEVWNEKAAAMANSYDFNADGASFNRNQLYQNAVFQARYWSARRMMGTITLRPEPE